MKFDDWQKLASAIQSIVTTTSIIVAGLWAYRRFIVQQEKYPNLIFSADINVIGKQQHCWLVELIAVVENKGKAQHKMKNFNFDLNGINNDEELTVSEKWGGQVDFSHPIAKGSFLASNMSFFFIDPGTTARYSYICKLPAETSFAILHCSFDYFDNRGYRHTAEKTIKVGQGN